MPALTIVLQIVHILLIVFLVLLWARIIVELVQAINRSWRPSGALLVVLEIVLTITDPPVKFARRVVPPLRLGPVALDLGVLVLLVVTIVLISIVSTLALVV